MPNWKKLIVSGSSANLSNLTVDNAVTASYFKGDGSGLTGVTTEIVETATVSDTFTSVTQKVVIHDFDTKDVIVTVYNDSDEQIIPASIVTTTVNSVTINFDSATSGRIVVAKGGHIVQGLGTAEDSNTLNGQSGSYYLDYANHTGAVTASMVSASYIDLNVIAAGNEPAHKAGRIFFSEEDGALSVYNEEADITLQLGQEFWVRAFNPTDNTILNGTPVRASGSQGDRIAIYPALAEDHTQGVHFDSHIIGVATHDIEASSEGYVTAQGIVRGVNTTGFAAGDTLYLQTGSAGLRNSPPPFPYDIVQVGYASKIAANGFIFVEPKEPVHFNNISGLSGSAQGPGDLWVYQANNAWAPTKTLSGSYTINGGGLTLGGDLLPSATEAYDIGSDSQRWRDLYLSGSTINLGGTLITRDANGNIEFKESGTNNRKTLKVDELEIQRGDKSVRLKLDDNNKVRFEDVDTGDTLAPTYFKTSISGNTTYNITHSLAEDYPIVQVYDTSKNQVLPASITSSNENVVQIVFDSNFNGTVVVKK